MSDGSHIANSGIRVTIRLRTPDSASPGAWPSALTAARAAVGGAHHNATVSSVSRGRSSAL